MCWRRMRYPPTATLVLILLTAASILLEPCSAQVYNLSLSIEEGLPAGTIVGDLRALLPEDTSNSGFFISESRESYVFKDLDIDGDTGIIATAVVLDRESRNMYEFVAATLTGEMIKVKIEVRDVNDHAPVFRRGIVSLNVSEQSPPGTKFQLEGAQDEDEGDFGTQGYQITSSTVADLFKVDYRNLFSLDLILVDKLDREIKDFYTFIIEAFDGGVPPKTGKLQVEIFVMDENDNSPLFNQSEYKVLVWENASPLTTVCQVHATDLDLGGNGQVTYEINRRQSDPNEVFIIDTNTGLIRLNKALDYESQPLHELIISARDNGVQPEYSSAFVMVTVLDINDNSPAINVMFLSESGDGEILEGASVGQYVARISVSDPDLGEVNKVKVSLEGGNGRFALKPLDDFLFSLCVDSELDREEMDMYELKIVASDFGAPPLWSEKTFLIKVSDINDSPPVFDMDSYVVNISEDVLPGSALLKVQAKDLDDGANSAIFYSIMKVKGGHQVSIDPKSGLITTVAPLDHEKESIIHFSVIAVDGGTPPLSTTAAIIVYVEDVNDNEPVFEKQLYNTSFPEHLPVGSCFLQVSATDADGSKFGLLRFSLIDNFDRRNGHQLFAINPESGDICVTQDIDRETGQVDHDVLVKAEDQGGLSSQTYVHIEVEDINDNRPVFNPEKYVTSISCHTPPGMEILNIIAADADSGTFGHISYNLLPGDLSSLFIVDASTGAMYLTSPLSHLGATSIKLYVSAHDGGGLSSTRPADITVNILRSDPAPTVFQRSRYSFSVSEDVPVGTPVGMVQASSPTNLMETLSYKISSGDPQHHFQVHPQSGLLSTLQILDRESQPFFLLVLQSYTSSSPIYSSTQVNVSISDVNDNPPVFSREQDSITISQGTVPGTALYIAHAHDKDTGTNGQIRYSLHSNGTGLFAVDARLGTIFLNQSLPRDGPSTYSLRIQAEDEGTPSLASVMMLSVAVDGPASEESLAFETLVYQVEMSESAQKQSRVIQVRAHGQGHHTCTGVSYSLLPVSQLLPFRIHAKSGWVVLDQNLDYESAPAYRFQVAATRAKSSTTATVIVTVMDENDNAPVFSQVSYFYSLPESSSPQGLVGTIKATDRDSRKNSQLSYILLSDGKHFRINPNTGEVTNWVALDREQQTHHTLEVLVTDHGLPRLNATCHVHILVTDVNDNPPQFTHLPAGGELSTQFWAGFPPSSIVTTMHAKDPDAGENGTVRYSMMSDDDLGHFEIDSTSGEIRSTSHFSEHPRMHYTLTVVATDNGPTPLDRTAVVHLQVLPDEQKSIPESQDFRHFSVREDVRPGTVVGSLELPEGQLRKIHYSITEGDSALYFGIDSSSGNLYIRQELDYESTLRHLFWVRAEHTGQGLLLNRSLLVIVSVEDVNDHGPWFPDDIITFGLEENLPVGTSIYTFRAQDGDSSGTNGALCYSIPSEPEVPFIIDQSDGTLTLAGPIDRERTESFAFMVSVTDRAEDPSDRKQASLTVQIHLLDVNDNRPIFVSTAETRVTEDTPLGSLLHRFIAKDEDWETNGLVTYSLVSGNDNGHYTLEEKTGVLYLTSSMDYELARVHTLQVKAVDSGHPPLSSAQLFTVFVVDVNDQAPEFEKDEYAAAVDENREPGELVVKVTAVDRDSAVNAAVMYSLLPGPGYELFSIDPQTGEIHTSTQLDRELWGHFSLTVLARDSGTPPLSSTTAVLCSVLDDNDNAPRFTRTSFWIDIPENLPPGVIHVAQAEDLDAGVNGTIQYSIEGDADGTFAVNTTTGAIRTLRSLDREERSAYRIIIKARDGGIPPRSSSIQLHLAVLDENDNSPIFSQKNYRVSVSEGVPVGSEVVQLTATDIDKGLSGEVSFSLLGDTLGAFVIDGHSGLVRTARPLDRETQAQYMFQAAATDSSIQGPRSSITTVVVHLEDVNDNTPVFTQSATTTVVPTNITVNQTVITVMASDADLGENGTVVFRLSEPDTLFDIGFNTGAICLKAPLPSSGFSGTKLLRVIASDQGAPVLSSSSLVLLVHLGRAEAGLHFTEQDYKASLPENSNTGSWVVTVFAQGQSTDQTRVKYSIFSGNEDKAFSINLHTGEISVKEPHCLDFEERREVHLVVLAVNGQQSAHCRVTIKLLDENDNAPSFEQDYYRTAVWEGQVLNTYITQVFAADQDGGVNGHIDYSIVSGNSHNAFLLDAERGILATNAVLDREIISSYKLVLHAVDRGSPRLTGTATVRVRVVDVNDNEPTIPSMKPIAIAENLPAGSSVTQVMANDVDISGTVTYSFAELGNGGGKFAINPYTGLITLAQSLDREEASDYVLKVCASDSVHQTEAELRVQVLDVNDNPPIFTKASYQVAVPELTAAGTSILAASATDHDAGLNGKLTYRLLPSPAKGFYISPHNGSLYTNKLLRYVSGESVIQLTVEARDGGEPSLATVTSVEVHVQDTNDHAPQFQQSTNQVSCAEDTAVGTTLLLLSAKDEDWSWENAQLDYTISEGNQERRFCMEMSVVQEGSRCGTVGNLILCNGLDRELTESYTLTVTASDRGTPSLNGSAVVTVTVVDVNDNTPAFVSTEYHIQVSESSPLDTLLTCVSAHDPDQGLNGCVFYDIVSGNGKGRLKLNRLSGCLELNQSLDYEEDSRFTLTIQASDGDGLGRRNVAFAVIFLSVSDENDNFPYFTFPVVNCMVVENQPAFSPVCTVRAVDHDAGRYGQLTYTILSFCSMNYGGRSPERKEAFAIDPFTGDINTKQIFDYEREREFCIVVEARDRGDQAAMVRVQIDVEGMDEFSPVFTQQHYLFQVPENAKVGQRIGQVKAMDHDDGLDGVVQYSLASPSPFFSINRTSGVVYLLADVYRVEGGENFEEMLVRASSPKIDSRTASCLVTVNISSTDSLLAGLATSVQTVSLSVFLAVFFLLFVSSIALILRYRRQGAAVKKGAPWAMKVIRTTETLDRTSGNSTSSISLKGSVELRMKRELMNPLRNSDSSGRGSAEAETAEDEEIKMINEHPCRNSTGSTLSDRASRVPDSGVPRDSEQLSCQSEDSEPMEPNTAGMGAESSESIHTFREEGGGEEMLPRRIRVTNLTDGTRAYGPLCENQTSMGGSLNSLLCAEEELRGSYSWDYLLNWEPRFQPLASVFLDIGQLPDGAAQARSLLEESQSLLRPPPLITSVAQPGIRAVPPRMPSWMPSQAATLMRKPSFPKYTYSPLARNTGLTPSAMTPSFSPAISLLTMRTPNASPVLSDTSLANCSTSGSRSCISKDGEM